MTVRRMMGTETEYAVSDSRQVHYNPVQLSFDVVGGAADSSTSHIRWDYRQEDPLNDARGTRLPRAAARADMLTDDPQRQIVNVIAPNGGRIYVDHAHPEYSAPETMDPFQAMKYEQAGDRLMLQATRKVNDHTGSNIVIHRNNVDGKGASWGSHENYMMLRSVPFDKVAALMTLHFVSRQIFTGSGRVGIGEKSEETGYQLSQRVDYIRSVVGLQTTFDRPIVNVRDESHATGQYRRLHVIVGDANRMDVPSALKLGTTSILLWLSEQVYASDGSNEMVDLDGLLADLQLVDPVEAMHTVSHDLTLAQPLPLEHGGTTTAWQIQVRLLSAVAAQGAATYGTDSRGEPLWPDEATGSTVMMWRQALADVAAVRHADADDRLVMQQEGSRLEWLLKWQLLERLRRKSGESWSSAKVAALDLSWADVDPARSVFSRVLTQTERISIDSSNDADVEIQRSASNPPEETRAWLRAEIVRRFAREVVAVSWSHITVSAQGAGGGNTGGNDESDTSSGLSDSSGTHESTYLYSLDISNCACWSKSRCEQILDDAQANHDSAFVTLKRLQQLSQAGDDKRA
ncbi:proteasome accessory factor A [Bifidobacterium commune]|uniref:Proteasome accessory factor A n=1 Tax=Bifidobacterium commune TaxID=1505727 RepID=A0A1C4H0S1_9BIFI|nr:depupylase/deamidase Dop [Bifidobacterium commune]MBB2954673.1 proteasome accessory factor A [Bifidobacterium commune]SCC78525.1 proteasome accessory factor A [Bifidobacterium commune]